MTYASFSSSFSSLPRRIFIVAAWLLAATGFALAQQPASAPATAGGAHADHHPAAPAADADELTEGEITRLDIKALKVTLRHGDIKNLNMPGMTMVFRVQEAALLEPLRAGDKVRFRAEQIRGAYVVTRIERVN